MILKENQKKLTWTVFGIYLFLLTWLVLFKFGLDFSALPHHRFVNLIPFKESLFPDGRFNFKEVVYNMIVFVPLGVYVGILWNKLPFLAKILPAFLLSLAYEVIQFTFAIGISDVTDIIGNTLGGICGLFVLMILNLLFKNKTETAVNFIGITVEICGLILMVTLAISNF